MTDKKSDYYMSPELLLEMEKAIVLEKHLLTEAEARSQGPEFIWAKVNAISGMEKLLTKIKLKLPEELRNATVQFSTQGWTLPRRAGAATTAGQAEGSGGDPQPDSP